MISDLLEVQTCVYIYKRVFTINLIPSGQLLFFLFPFIMRFREHSTTKPFWYSSAIISVIMCFSFLPCLWVPAEPQGSQLFHSLEQPQSWPPHLTLHSFWLHFSQQSPCSTMCCCLPIYSSPRTIKMCPGGTTGAPMPWGTAVGGFAHHWPCAEGTPAASFPAVNSRVNLVQLGWINPYVCATSSQGSLSGWGLQVSSAAVLFPWCGGPEVGQPQLEVSSCHQLSGGHCWGSKGWSRAFSIEKKKLVRFKRTCLIHSKWGRGNSTETFT